MAASDPPGAGRSWMVSLQAVTPGVILSISTKPVAGSWRVMYQTASTGSAEVMKTQSGSATPEDDATQGGSQPSIQSASRTGQRRGNTAVGSATRRWV